MSCHVKSTLLEGNGVQRSKKVRPMRLKLGTKKIKPGVRKNGAVQEWWLNSDQLRKSARETYDIHSKEIKGGEILKKVSNSVRKEIIEAEGTSDIEHTTYKIYRAQVKKDLIITPVTDCKILECNDPLAFVGDKFKKKGNNVMRIFYNNCNSIAINALINNKIKDKKDKDKVRYLGTTKDGTKFEQMLEQLLEWEVDVMCLTEPCVAWEIPIATKVVNMITKKFDNGACWNTSTSITKSSSLFKPGGTSTMVSSNYTGKIVERSQDWSGMGRWNYVVIQGKNERRLVIITGYRCGANNIKYQGDTTAYTQQYTIMRERGIMTPDPAKAFLDDLSKMVIPRLQRGEDIILCIDANEEWKNTALITSFARQHAMYNIARERFQTLPATKPSSGKTIDFILATQRVVECTTAFGVTPYNLEVLGDHRGMFMDIDIKEFFEWNQSDTQLTKQRKLKSNDKKTTKKYIKRLKDKLEYHKVYDRLERLVEIGKVRKTLNDEEIKEYNAIQRDVYRSCANAEKHCSGGRRYSYWSPKVKQSILERRYWKIKLDMLQSGSNSSNQLKYIKEKLKINDNSTTILEVENKLKESEKTHKEVMKHAKELRGTYLSELAEKYAEDNNLSIAKAIQELMLHEEEREIYKTIASKMKKYEKTQLDRIWVRREDTMENNEENKVEINVTKEINKKLLQRNRKHLNQAYKTPFARGALHDALKDGDSETIDDILSGSWVPPSSAAKYIKEYVKELKLDGNMAIDEVQPMVTQEEFVRFWRRKRETTATSPFGPHVGHYKTAIQDETICEVHRTLMNLPLMYGFAPELWAKSVQLMLQKDPGKPWVNRLRIIELLDANFNAALMIVVGRNMIHNANDKGAIHHSAYGSVPGRSPQDALLHKVVTMDLFRQKKQCGALFECDASGCYDRIIPNFQVIHTRRLGLAKSVAIAMAKILKKMKRYVATKYGISTNYIKTNKDKILYGIGQGSGSGPAVWLSHLIVMFKLMTILAEIPVFENPAKTLKHKAPGTGFVDDCNLFAQGSGDGRDGESVTKKMQDNAQRWERYLYTNGGKLELKKCYWSIIIWTWIGGVAKIKKEGKIKGTLQLKQSEAKQGSALVKVEKKSNADAGKVLGVHANMIGTWKIDGDRWIGESRAFAGKVWNAHFDRTCGAKLYQFLWVPKFRYAAGIIGFSKHQARKIESPVIRACLAAAGFNRNFPRAVIHGPIELGGLGWERHRTVQVYEGVNLLLRSLKKKNELGNLLRITIETEQLILGIGKQILDGAKVPLYAEKTWTNTLMILLQEANIKIKIADIWVPTPKREKDVILMDVFNRYMNKKDLQRVNQCRLYLQVTCLSEITSIAGTEIEQEYYSVERKRISMLEWPNQHRPGQRSIETWKKAMEVFVYKNTRELRIPLGEWVTMPEQRHKYFDQLKIKRQINKVMAQEKLRTPRIKGNLETGLRQYVNQLPEYKKRVLGRYMINTELLRQLLNSWKGTTNLKIATDGGLKKNRGSHAYAWFSDENKEILWGYASEKTKYIHATSTREELLAILASLYMVETVQNIFNKDEEQLKIEIVTDSEAAKTIRERVKHVDYFEGDNHMMAPEMDVDAEIEATLTKLKNVQLEYVWTKGHNMNDEDDNDHRTVMNDRVDRLATQARREAKCGVIEDSPYPFFPGTVAAVVIKNEVIHNRLKKIVLSHCESQDTKKYLMEKYGWTNETYNLINWEAHGRCINSYKWKHRISLYKYIHGWLQTNRRKYMYMKNSEKEARTTAQNDNGMRRKEGYECSQCGHREDRTHMFKCQSHKMRKERKHGWRLLKKK